jgi:drug/metabolite transporter (DMT)-like permease
MRKRDLLLLALVNAIWAGHFTAVKIGLRQLGPYTMVAFPMLASVVLLGVVIHFERRRGTLPAPHFSWAELPTGLKFVLLGLGPVIAQLGYSFGVRYSLASTASVMSLLTPVLCAIMAILLLGERMTRLRGFSFLLAAIGALLILGVSPEMLKGMALPYLRGNLILLVGCSGSAFYNVYCKKLLGQFSAVEVLYYSLMVSSAVLVPLAVAREGLVVLHFSHLTFSTLMSLVYLGLLSYGVAMILFFRIIRRIDMIVASLSIYLMPVFGVLIAWVALREGLTRSTIVGGVLVAAGTLLVSRFDAKTTAKPGLKDGSGNNKALAA